jgi:DNA-3-methyladenine glycosylase
VVLQEERDRVQHQPERVLTGVRTASDALPREFFERDALALARALVGTYLVHAMPGEPPRVARIVETEAYRGPDDAACHARAGRTARTRPMFGPAGHAYVFLIYGMYDCFNVVAWGGRGHAVLVRAVEPIAGVPTGARGDGPGRLTRAMGITRAHDGADLTRGSLTLRARDRRTRIATSARVGVAYAGVVADEPWRFYDAASEHVSRPAAKAIGLGVQNGPPKNRAQRDA